MNKEELFEVLEDLDETKIQEAGKYTGRKKMSAWRKWGTFAACAAVCLIAAVLISRFRPGAAAGEGAPGMPRGLVLAAAVYPNAVAENMSAQDYAESDVHWAWWDEYRQKIEASAGYQKGMTGYYQEMMEKILPSDEDNTVCSPLNTYVAFAVLAEVTGGNTRQQILDMLHVKDLAELRTQVKALWESNYVDTPTLKSLLANSLWLREGTECKEETLREVAQNYYASVFGGDPESEEMNKALREWTDENTGGLLKEYSKDMKLNGDTVLAIISTICYKAAWNDEFREENNTQETFHGVNGDTTVDMMHRSDMMGVYRTDTFTSVGLGLQDSGAMYFYLPAEGTNVNNLLSDPNLLSATVWSDDPHWSSPHVNLSVPKFRVSGKTDLLSTIRGLGITDALDPYISDFTPLTEDEENLFISQAEHAAMVEIDENGVTGAAYTELLADAGADIPDEEVDLVFDRPFLFIVTGRDGSVLFSGVVRSIE